MTISGLAAAIRGSTESDTFDLAGQNPSTITTNISQAFQDPFPLDEMIRITFVTGAGKLGRQKYDEGCSKAVTSTLRDLGFQEDKGASCVRECAGLFKLQHDTGKNLKTVVVFPRIREKQAGPQSSDDPQQAAFGEDCVWLQKGSPEELIALSPVDLFAKVIPNRLFSWSQKKGCNQAITELSKVIASLEEKLLEGVVLEDSEQTLYDAVSVDDLQKKHNLVKEAMQQQIQDGNITLDEKEQLLRQVDERIEGLNDELEAAQSKPKKAEKLRGMKTKAEQRKAMLAKISPKPPSPLRYQSEILALHTELLPLLKLEESTKGRLLSVKETKTLARKDEILEEIAQLEQDSRGWFEDEVSFEARLKKSRATGKQAANKASAKKSTTKKTTSSPWVSTSMARPKTSYGKKSTTKKKTSTKSGESLPR